MHSCDCDISVPYKIKLKVLRTCSFELTEGLQQHQAGWFLIAHLTRQGSCIFWLMAVQELCWGTFMLMWGVESSWKLRSKCLIHFLKYKLLAFKFTVPTVPWPEKAWRNYPEEFTEANWMIQEVLMGHFSGYSFYWTHLESIKANKTQELTSGNFSFTGGKLKSLVDSRKW